MSSWASGSTCIWPASRRTPSRPGRAWVGRDATGSRTPAAPATRKPTLRPDRSLAAVERDVIRSLAAREGELVDLARQLIAAPSPNPPGDERGVAELAR